MKNVPSHESQVFEDELVWRRKVGSAVVMECDQNSNTQDCYGFGLTLILFVASFCWKMHLNQLMSEY